MPELARSYNLSVDDLVADDAITYAKRKMLKQIREKKDEEKTLMNTENLNVEDADPKMVNDNYLGLHKLLKSSYIIMKEIDNRIKVWAGGNTKSVIKESDTAILEIFDRIDRIADNFRTMKEILPTIFPVSKYVSFSNYTEMDKLLQSYTDFVLRFYTTKIDTIPPSGRHPIFHLSATSSYTAQQVVEKIKNDLLTPIISFNRLYDKFSNNWNQSHRPITATD